MNYSGDTTVRIPTLTGGREREEREESAAAAYVERTDGRPWAKKLCYCTLSQPPAPIPPVVATSPAFQGAVVNIHEPRAPVVILPIVTRPPRRTEIRKGTSGAAGRSAGHGGREGISIEFSKGGRENFSRQGLKPVLIPMTPARMCLAPIVVMNRENERLFHREGKE